MKLLISPPMRYLGAKRGFSIAEILISMTIIILLSVLGFTACYIALGAQRNAQRNLAILSAMDAASDAFSAVAEEIPASSEEEQKSAFIGEFNRRLAFALNSYAPDVRGMEEANGFGWRQNWEIHIVNRSETEYEVQVVDGVEQIVERQVAIDGLDLTYRGAESGGYCVFVYRYFTERYEVELTLNLVYTDYYTLYLRGRRNGSDLVAFEWGMQS